MHEIACGCVRVKLECAHRAREFVVERGRETLMWRGVVPFQERRDEGLGQFAMLDAVVVLLAATRSIERWARPR